MSALSWHSSRLTRAMMSAGPTVAPLADAHEIGGDANQALGPRHEQCRRHPLAGDVTDQKAEHSVLGQEEIVEVAADLTRRLHAGEQVEGKLDRRRRERVRHHRHLQAARRLQLLLQPRQMRLDLVAQPLLLERGAEPSLEQHRVERLEQIVDRAELDAAHHAVHLVERRDHDHRKIAQTRLILEPVQHPIAVDLRHHHVEQNQVEFLTAEPRDRFLAVVGGLDPGVAFELEIEREGVAVVVVVIDDQDARPLLCRSIVGHRCHPIRAGGERGGETRQVDRQALRHRPALNVGG